MYFPHKPSFKYKRNDCIECVYLLFTYWWVAMKLWYRVMFMSRLVFLARVAGCAAVESGKHTGGPTNSRGVDATHGAGDGEAGADVGQRVTRDPRAGGIHLHLGARVQVRTSWLTQSASNLKRQQWDMSYKRRKWVLIPGLRPEDCRCSWCPDWQTPSCWWGTRWRRRWRG